MRLRNLLVTAVIAAVAGCSKASAPVDAPAAPASTAPTSVPSGSLLAKTVVFQLAVYGLGRNGPVRAAAVEALARKRGGLEVVSERPKAPPSHPVVWVAQQSLRDYAPPDLELLRYFGRGLSPSQAEQLTRSDSVVTLTFAAPQPQALKTLRLARELVLQAATASGGIIWDEESRLAFTPERWKADRLDAWTGPFPSVADSTALHAYPDGSGPQAGLRLVTLGMSKFGLPDLSIDGVPSSFSVPASLLIDLVAQSLLEHPSLEQGGALTVRLDGIRDPQLAENVARAMGKGAARSAEVKLAMAKRQEGDADNRLLAIVFPGEGPLAERQYALLSHLFGSAEQGLSRASAGDAELKAASERARAQLPAVKRRFLSEKEHLYRLTVKKGFAAGPDQGTEYMWIEVRDWRGHRLQGVLINEPDFVKGLHEGAPVSLDESEIYDYVYALPDGGSEGGETEKVFQQRGTGPSLP